MKTLSFRGKWGSYALTIQSSFDPNFSVAPVAVGSETGPHLYNVSATEFGRALGQLAASDPELFAEVLHAAGGHVTKALTRSLASATKGGAA